MDLESAGDMQPRINFRRVTLTVILTMITAYLLSVFGYLPVNPVYATAMGSFIGVVYVFYEICVGRQMFKQRRKLDESDKGVDLI